MGSKIIKKEVVGGIFSSSYYTDSKDTKHEEIFPPITQNISIEQGLDFIIHSKYWEFHRQNFILGGSICFDIKLNGLLTPNT
jgi:hypothetical protein